jgi:hypothetical protein
LYIAKLQETDCRSCGIGTQEGFARYVGWNPSNVQGDAGEGRENIPFKSKECAVIDFHFMSFHFIIPLIGFNCTEDENDISLSMLRKRAWLALRAKIDEQTADTAILGKLRSHFEERFRYDEHGVPRVWKPDDDIDGTFKKAKDQVRLDFVYDLVYNNQSF